MNMIEMKLERKASESLEDSGLIAIKEMDEMVESMELRGPILKAKKVEEVYLLDSALIEDEGSGSKD